MAVDEAAVAVEHLFAAIPVGDVAAATSHYERLLGRAPDLLPNEREAAWQLTATGWIYLVLDAARAGSALQTILVDDLNGFLGEVQARGIEAGPVELLANGVRQALFADADGNRLKVGQVPR